LYGLIILPILLVIGTVTPDILGMDLENSNPSDPAEADDFFILPNADLKIAGFTFSKFTAENLGFQSAVLPPIIPPPR
jgi:hypothetical protein